MAKRDEIKKVTDISNEGSRYDNLKATAKVANIQERFDDTTHNDNPYDDALQYIKKKVDQIISQTNTVTSASGSNSQDIKNLTLASGSFSTRVTANDAKVTSQFPVVTHASTNYVATIQGVHFTPQGGGQKYNSLQITVVSQPPGAPASKVVFELRA